jgi:hypothetical protein
MTAPGGGGDRLEVSVVADASGFARDAQAKIDAVTAGVKAKIALDVDARRLSAQLAVAARQADTLNKIEIKVGVDNKAFQASLASAVAEANARNYAVKVKVEVDRSQLAQASAAAGAAGGTITHRIETVGGGDSSVRVTADTTAARAEIGAMRREESGRIINVPVQVDQSGGGGDRGRSVAGRGIIGGAAGLVSNITRDMSGLEKFGFIAGLIQAAGAAVDALGAGLISVAGAASQAVGALAVLPNLVGVAAQGVGALVLGFSGISKAVQLSTKAQAAGARSGQASADAQIRAQEAVANARQNVANTIKAGNDRIVSAEHAVAQAQLASRAAQQALTQARKDAEQALKDYKNQLADAALNEESATLAIEKARESWNNTMRSPVSTELDRKEADLALRQAEQNLVDIKASNEQLQQQADDATKKGVEGAASVVNAKQGVADATYNQAQAEKQLADDRVKAAQDNVKAQQQLADAIRSLNQATNQSSAANSQLAAALAKLSPAGREFVRFVQDELTPRFTKLKQAVQESLLPPVERGVRAALPLLGTLQDGLVQSGAVMGSFVEKLGVMMGSKLFRDDVASIMASNNKALGLFTASGLDLVTVLRNLAVVAEPLLDRFSKWVKTWADWAAGATTAGRETGKLQAFMQRAGDRAAQLGDIVGNLVGALFGMGKAGTGAGGDLLDSLQKVTQHWSDWANSAAGQATIKKYMDDLVPVLKTVGSAIANIVKVFVELGQHKETLAIIFGVVDTLAKGIAWLLNIPFVGPFITGLMGLAGVGVILLALIKKLTKIKDLFESIGKVKTGVGKVATRIGDAVDANRPQGTTTDDRKPKARPGPDDAPDEVITRTPRERLDIVRQDTLRARQEAGRPAGSRRASLRSRAAGRIRSTVTRVRTEEGGSMRADFGLTGGGSRTPRGGRVRGAVGKARSGVSTVSSLRGGSAPRMGTASNGDAVGGLGGEVAGFAAAVGKASTTASKYLGGWAGDATKTVGDWATKASTTVADWSDRGVGKAVSTAGGYIKQFASGNGETIKKFGGDALDSVKKVGPKIGEWAKALKDVQIGQKLAAAAGKAWAGVQWLLNAAMDANPIGLIIVAIGLLVAGFIWAWTHIDGFKQFFIGAWDAIKGAVSGVIDWVKEHWPLLLAILTGPIGLVVLFIVSHWQQIKDATAAAFNWVKDTALGIWNGLVNGIKGALSGIAGFVGGAFSGIGNAIKAALNFVIGGINGTVIAGVNLVIRGMNDVNPFSDIPRIPNIPKLARGAVIKQPTLAVVGEAGDELVLPLSPGMDARRAELLAQAGISAATSHNPGQGLKGLGGWGAQDAVGGSLAQQLSASRGSATAAAPRDAASSGTYIAEGAIKVTAVNPAPEPASDTLNKTLRRVADLGIFGAAPAGG